MIPIERGKKKEQDKPASKSKAKAKAKAKAKGQASFRRKLSKMAFSPQKAKTNGNALVEAGKAPEEPKMLSHLDFDLPEETYPQGPRTGLQSYTIKSICVHNGMSYLHAAVEVQLFNRKFFVKKTQTPLTVSPSVAWSKHSSIAAAWDQVKVMTEGWYSVSAE